MKPHTFGAVAAACLAGCASMGAPTAPAVGPVTVPAFVLPYSSYASPEANAIATQARARGTQAFADVAAARAYYGQFNDDRLAEMQKAFTTTIEQKTLGGVKVAWVTPAQGVAEANRERVLINVHGGAFMWGSGSGALIEAIPIAATARIAVATVDYRLAPENAWPSTSEDVSAVYQALLKTYRPENIGIYGCSAGGVITAQMIPWLRTHGLPPPGAIGTLCGTGYPAGGDSLFLAAAALGEKIPGPEMAGPGPLPVPYLQGVALDDPLAYPAASDQVLRCFPPTLMMAGGRDFTSSMLTTVHRHLAAVDVYSELYLFDGLWHAFFMYPDLPESREAYGLIARFFDRQLGKVARSCDQDAMK
jgi:monoterpene epsilon-lactone hydrolase